MNLIRKTLIFSAGLLFAYIGAATAAGQANGTAAAQANGATTVAQPNSATTVAQPNSTVSAAAQANGATAAAQQSNGAATAAGQSLNGNDKGNVKGRICLVDDDFKQGKVFDYKHLMDSLGIRCSFSIFPNDGDPEYYKQWQKDSIKAWQNEGYSFLLHPRHSCWRSDRYKSADECEESLLNSIEAMRTTAAIDWEDYIVYPGASGKNPEVVQMVGKYVRYGVGQSGSLKVEGAPIPLPRIFIKPTSDPAKIKERIRAKLEKGELVILGTHSYEFSKASFPLLIDIIEYSKTLAEFTTLQKALAGAE